MKTDIESRELITVVVDGAVLQGTYHKCPHRDLSPLTPGLLFLNYGSTPRAGSSDSAVYWADSFARMGYPSFRFDLPGLGDSEGYLPREMVDYANLVNAGHYTTVTSRIARILTDRFKLGGLVVEGHCASAVAAILAAADCSDIKGLILVTPYFHLQVDSTARVRLSSLALGSTIGRCLRMAYKHLKHAVQTKGLPRNANMPLIQSWNQLTSAELPILVLTRSDPKLYHGYFNYLAYLQQANSNRGRIFVKSFMESIGKELFRKEIECWLCECFPMAERDVFAKITAAEE